MQPTWISRPSGACRASASRAASATASAPAARPHEAQDPIAAAAQLINAIYLFIPRTTDSLDSVVVTIGQVIAGDNLNVIPERVELYGTLRTLDREVRKKAIDHIRRLAHGVGQTS